MGGEPSFFGKDSDQRGSRFYDRVRVGIDLGVAQIRFALGGSGTVISA
jgi:hypothetical protein